MTASNIAGAASHNPTEWHTIDWEKAHREVRRLQARIVKATQEGRWNKVNALQRLLTHSFSGKALAVKRVTENQGKWTPGVDKITWETPSKKAQAIQELQQRGYQPLPLRRVYILKNDGINYRPLSIPTMKDRAMQALYLLAVDPVAETKADRNSYGFRTERSCADAIEQCFILLAKKNSPQWILEGDIKACFDQIDHNWMLSNIPMDKSILQKWLKAGYIEKDTLHATDEGTPQGGICSPVLANITLDGLEQRLKTSFPDSTRAKRKIKSKVHLVRYADDFIITGNSKELLQNEVKPLIEQFLAERGLSLSPTKTIITHIDQGFNFLGQNVRKYNGKLLIKPSKPNIKRFLKKVRVIIKANPTITAGKLIEILNPKIHGWANYHQHVVSSRIFDKIDFAIFKTLWHWAKRRHPNKGLHWIQKKYFHSNGSRSWVFFGTIERSTEKQLIDLRYAGDTPIKRHTKIKGDANPYDPQWETYFEQRLDVSMLNNLKGRRRLIYLWKEQQGICPVCNQKITKLTGWHSHHIVWRNNGGSDSTENRVLLHPNCHNRVHNQGLEVTKPRPLTKASRKA